MNWHLLCIVVIALPTVLAANPAEITKESAEITARVVDADDARGWPRLELRRRTGGGEATIELGRVKTVKDILFVGPDRVIVHGELGSGGDIVKVIDGKQLEAIDTVWGRGLSISPSERKLAYEFRIPPSMGQTRLSPGLVIYDLTMPPSLNAMSSGTDNPEERGIVVYPAEFRAAKRYWALLEPGQPERRYVSPIAWSADSRRLAVVENDGVGRDDRLVVVDLSSGVNSPSVLAVPVRHEDFLDPASGVAAPDRYAESYPVFRELRFRPDGTAVEMTSWPNGPFTEKTVTVALPAFP